VEGRHWIIEHEIVAWNKGFMNAGTLLKPQMALTLIGLAAVQGKLIPTFILVFYCSIQHGKHKLQ
jgi:hypothetical protein